MAMNNSNYGFPPSSSLSSPPYSAQFASTPANPRPQRPRFGFSNVPSYPRPRSSAAKPNPENFSENLNSYGDVYEYDMRTNYHNSDNPLDNMRNYFAHSDNTTDRMRNNYSNSNSAMDSMRNNYGSPGMMDSMRNNYDTPGMIDSTRNNYGSPGMVDSTRNNYGSPGIMDSMRNNYGSPGVMDSMRNNYGSLDIQRNDTYPLENTAHSNIPFRSSDSSAYYSCKDSFFDSTKYSPISATSHTASYSKSDTFGSFPSSRLPSQNLSFGINSGKGYGGHFQNRSNKNFKQDSSTQGKPFHLRKEPFKKKPSTEANPNPFEQKNPGQLKRNMASKSDWQCTVCGIEFTSGVPLEMHLRGAKHAKKLKSQDVLQSIQLIAAKTEGIKTTGNTLICEICNIHANSSLQLQMHLDGVKHKNMVMKLAKEKGESEAKPELEVNGKSNGSTVRPLPEDFGEPQPAKLTKFSCEICSLILNSETQLQQHLTSKKHQAKVEGKPMKIWKPKSKSENEEEQIKDNPVESKADEEKTPMETETEKEETSETAVAGETAEPKVVVGVKSLSSSFVQGKSQE